MSTFHILMTALGLSIVVCRCMALQHCVLLTVIVVQCCGGCCDIISLKCHLTDTMLENAKVAEVHLQPLVGHIKVFFVLIDATESHKKLKNCSDFASTCLAQNCHAQFATCGEMMSHYVNIFDKEEKIWELKCVYEWDSIIGTFREVAHKKKVSFVPDHSDARDIVCEGVPVGMAQILTQSHTDTKVIARMSHKKRSFYFQLYKDCLPGQANQHNFQAFCLKCNSEISWFRTVFGHYFGVELARKLRPRKKAKVAAVYSWNEINQCFELTPISWPTSSDTISITPEKASVEDSDRAAGRHPGSQIRSEEIQVGNTSQSQTAACKELASLTESGIHHVALSADQRVPTSSHSHPPQSGITINTPTPLSMVKLSYCVS